jgi:hypothetical protein
MSTEEKQFLITSFGGNIQAEAFYMAEELFGIANNICPLYSGMDCIVDLTSFKRRLHTSPVR